MLDIKCPKKDCGKSNWRFMGYKKEVEGEEKIQRFYCKECHREFQDFEILNQFEGATLESLRENIRLSKQKHYHDEGKDLGEEGAEIVYLDKKVKEDGDWRAWLAHMKEHQVLSKKNENSQDEAEVRIFPGKNGKAGVCISADWHLGSLFTDYDLLQKNLELILNTPYIYQITVGDIVHNFRKFKSLLCVHTQIASPKEQGAILSMILKEFMEKKKWICATWGNHDVSMDEQLYGNSPIADLLSEILVYFNGKGRLNLLVGEQKYIIEMSHFYPGHSILNPNHSQGRQLRHYSPDADVIVQGHIHQPACQWYYYNGRRICLVQVGSGTTEDNYFKRFWTASQPGVPLVTFHADRHEVALYPSLEEYLEK